MTMDLVFFFGALVSSAFLNEVSAAGKKVQGRVLSAFCRHALAGLIPAVYIVFFRHGSPVSFLAAWAGAFLSWFAVRSHLESSILLRMVLFLRREELAGGELLARYRQAYGAGQRTAELVNAGLMQPSAEGYRLTGKGKLILGVARMLG